MTTLDFLRAALRHWYVLVLGVLATAVLYATATAAPPVYTAKVTLVVLAPQPDSDWNALQQPSPVAIAAVAVMQVTNTPLRLTAASDEAPLVGKGITSGRSIELRHAGSQWVPSAPQPYIDIEAADADPERVRALIARSAEEIKTAIAAQEDRFEVRRTQRVTVTQSPTEPNVTSVPQSRLRALGGSVLIGLGVTAWAVVRVSGARERRKAAKRAGARTEDELAPTPA